MNIHTEELITDISFMNHTATDKLVLYNEKSFFIIQQVPPNQQSPASSV
jgi:hypothetical protein